ncbi:MAG: hypothetical protein ACI31S_01360 [Bacilli bacterium]
MKRFYYKVENTTKNPSIYGGRKQMATIYTIKKGKLITLGITRQWNTASYRGKDSEVNEWLLENKIIPKSWSKGYEWETSLKCKGGYYTPYYHENDKYSITEI